MISVAPPRQWPAFLAEHPDQDATPEVLEFTNENWCLILAANEIVNRFLYQYEDRDRWGLLSRRKIAGDCDDFALTKRAWLGKILPMGAFRPTLCKVQGRGHMVLSAVTYKGIYILDNLVPWVMPVEKRRGVKWLARWNGPKWIMLGGTS